MGEDVSRDGQPRTLARFLLERAERHADLRNLLVERWARAARWTHIEGIALAWTMDPKTITTRAEISGRRLHLLPEEARHYLDMAERVPTLEMRFNKNTPATFIAWAESVGLAFHQDWHDALKKPPVVEEPVMRRQRQESEKRALLVRRWAAAPYWNLKDGVALAYDLEPKEVIKRGVTGYFDDVFAVPDDAHHLLDLAERAVEVGSLKHQTRPSDFLAWAATVGVEFAPDWWDALKPQQSAARGAHKSDPAFPSGEAREADVSTKERESLLKLVIGMAMKGYSYNPLAARNDATSDIAGDLNLLGIGLDPDTIRKYLKEGTELLPPQDETE